MYIQNNKCDRTKNSYDRSGMSYDILQLVVISYTTSEYQYSFTYFCKRHHFLSFTGILHSLPKGLPFVPSYPDSMQQSL